MGLFKDISESLDDLSEATELLGQAIAEEERKANAYLREFYAEIIRDTDIQTVRGKVANERADAQNGELLDVWREVSSRCAKMATIRLRELETEAEMARQRRVQEDAIRRRKDEERVARLKREAAEAETRRAAAERAALQAERARQESERQQRELARQRAVIKAKPTATRAAPPPPKPTPRAERPPAVRPTGPSTVPVSPPSPPRDANRALLQALAEKDRADGRPPERQATGTDMAEYRARRNLTPGIVAHQLGVSREEVLAAEAARNTALPEPMRSAFRGLSSLGASSTMDSLLPPPETPEPPTTAGVLTGADLKRWRGTEKVSQRQAAERLGVAHGTVGKAEALASAPLPPVLQDALSRIALP